MQRRPTLSLFNQGWTDIGRENLTNKTVPRAICSLTTTSEVYQEALVIHISSKLALVFARKFACRSAIGNRKRRGNLFTIERISKTKGIELELELSCNSFNTAQETHLTHSENK